MQGHTSIRAALAWLILLVATLSVAAQTPSAQEADTLFQAQKWAEAAKAYDAITKAEPTNARAWNRLGSALQAMSRYEQAVDAYQRAVEIGNNPVVMYNLATALSKLNNKEKAFEWLRKAVAAGFAQVGQLEKSTDLAPLRDDPRFEEALGLARKNAKPCSASPQYRQFDFWIGEWDVQNPQGQPAGTSSIQLILGDCIIFENWTSAGGNYTGKSFNLYNATTGKWQQTWVDDKGGVLQFAGEYRDGELRYTGESPDAKGNRIMHRLTFFNLSKERVRQLWEQSTDDGKSWTTVFDGMYIRKK
jgi:tetratricopeptide (TPR) repeat protein